MNRRSSINKYFCISLLVCGAATFQAHAAESAQITFTMNVPTPTCSVSVPATKDLGELKYGVVEHNNFPVSVTCSGEVRHALTAEPVERRGLQSDNERVFVPIGGSTPSADGPFLSLREGNSMIKLSGNRNDAFCNSAADDHACYIIPVTEVTKRSPVGQGSVAIRFNLIHM